MKRLGISQACVTRSNLFSHQLCRRWDDGVAGIKAVPGEVPRPDCSLLPPPVTPSMLQAERAVRLRQALCCLVVEINALCV